MHRTQLYLDDDLWKLLHATARGAGSTISELVRGAVREKYALDTGIRREAFQQVAGLWKDREDPGGTAQYVRRLRNGSRLKKLAR
ncbi:MAG: CopG family transcriptional regulator [Bryobacteraceae bacterium]